MVYYYSVLNKSKREQTELYKEKVGFGFGYSLIKMMMGIMVLKQFSFLFLLISGSLLSSTSLAGRHFKSGNKFDKSVLDATDEVDILGSMDQKGADQISTTIHERLLRVNTKDYGRYDPAPALVKPPFKLIPN